MTTENNNNEVNSLQIQLKYNYQNDPYNTLIFLKLYVTIFVYKPYNSLNCHCVHGRPQVGGGGGKDNLRGRNGKKAGYSRRGN